jgi:hypothetical protein
MDLSVRHGTTWIQEHFLPEASLEERADLLKEHLKLSVEYKENAAGVDRASKALFRVFSEDSHTFRRFVRN